MPWNNFSATEVECTLSNFPHYFATKSGRNVFFANWERKMPGTIIRVQENLANYPETNGDRPEYFSVLFVTVSK